MGMENKAVWIALATCFSVGACGGSANTMGEAEEPPVVGMGDDSAPANEEDMPAEEEEVAPGEMAPEEPAFTPGMSVVEATNAVPNTFERLNIEQEALARPLMQPELYEPCGLQAHNHFQLKVAVWDGRAVGVDVTTKPKDEKLEACIRQQIGAAKWEDKAKSINTVEYSY